MERKDKKEVVRKLWDKYKAAALILTVGVTLLLWPSGGEETEGVSVRSAAQAEPETLLQMEERMEKILSRIQGVGQLELMLTLENSARQELAADTDLSYSGSTSAPDDYTRRSETVIVSGSDGDTPVVEYSVSPSYRGAVVVCEGAENASVRLAVTQAVSALTGLGSDRIVVIKCQS